MPISGPVVHQQLMDAYNRVQADLKVQRERLASGADGREELFERRSDALVKLAEHYLPELTPEAVRRTWTEVQPSFHELLRRKEADIQNVSQHLQIAIAEKEQQEQILMSVDADLDSASDRQDEVAAKVESALQANEDFVQLSNRAAVAEAALERAEANLQEIDQDSARKLPAYEQSTLFRYLQDRGFGTPAYQSRGFTRRMDRWVAKMVDYNKSKQGYEFLKETPLRMRQIIAEDRESLDLVMTDLEHRRDDVARELGLPDRIEQVGVLMQRRDQVLDEIDSLLHQCNVKQEELTQIEDPRGTHYREAINLFRDMLSRIDTDDLELQARLTAEIFDDRIVADVIGVDTQIESLDDAARRHQREVSLGQTFLEDLGKLVQRFRSAGFDSSRSQFVGSLDIVEELNRARSVGDAELLWERIRSNQRWGPTAMEKITAVATHPMTQVLINAMAHAAGGALQDHARRAGRRRNGGYGGGRGQWGGSWSGGSSSSWGRRR